MSVIVGSARCDENGKYTNGKAGDQTGNEVATQAFYVSSKGWNVLRAKSADVASKLGQAMQIACSNNNIGYDQNGRLGVITNGIQSTVKTEADCSSLVRACIIWASGKDVGNFTTYNEKSVLLKSGLFDFVGKYTSGMALKAGDILVTCTKGHTVIVIEGSATASASYYPKYTGSSSSIVSVLKAIGETDTSFTHRKQIAVKNGISNYSGTASQNLQMVALAKSGKLQKV